MRVFTTPDKVAVPFVAAPLIFDSWHSNVAPFYLDAAARCYLFQLGWAKKKKKRVHRLGAAGEDGRFET